MAVAISVNGHPVMVRRLSLTTSTGELSEESCVLSVTYELLDGSVMLLELCGWLNISSTLPQS